MPHLLPAFIGQGGRIAICNPCMIHNGLGEGQVDRRSAIIGAPDAVDLLMGATGTSQVT